MDVLAVSSIWTSLGALAIPLGLLTTPHPVTETIGAWARAGGERHGVWRARRGVLGPLSVGRVVAREGVLIGNMDSCQARRGVPTSMLCGPLPAVIPVHYTLR